MEEKTDKVVATSNISVQAGLSVKSFLTQAWKNSRMKFWIPWIVGGQ